MATIPAGSFPFASTIAASGGFNIEGNSPAGNLRAHGQPQFCGDGSVLVQMDYQLMKPPGPPAKRPNLNAPDTGFMILLRDARPPGPPTDVMGTWDGTYQSSMDPADTGAVVAEVTDLTDAGFTGTMTIRGIELPFMEFPFVGTVGEGASDPATPCHIIGLGPAGWFLVSGELMPGDPAGGSRAELMAQYQLFFADGSRDQGSLDLMQN